jgi:hypothetical protein
VQLLQRLYAQFLMQRPHPLGPKPRNLEQSRDGRRQLLAQAFQLCAGAGCQDLPDFSGQVQAYAWAPDKVLALIHQDFDAPAELTEHARSVTVGAHAKHVGALHFKQVSDFVEDRGNVRVDDGHGMGLAL